MDRQPVRELEGVRLDLLRLHAGSSDLAPLTILLDAARQLAADVDRLARAQDEVEARAESSVAGGAHRDTRMTALTADSST